MEVDPTPTPWFAFPWNLRFEQNQNLKKNAHWPSKRSSIDSFANRAVFTFLKYVTVVSHSSKSSEALGDLFFKQF